MEFYMDNKTKEISIILFPVNLSAYIGNSILMNGNERVSILEKKDVKISLSDDGIDLIVKINGTELDRADKITFARALGYIGLKDFYEDYKDEFIRLDKKEMLFVAAYLA